MGGDPLNFSDPFGLKVCYKGDNAADIQSLKRGTEDATNSTITLDADNCIAGVESREGPSGFNSLQQKLDKLVNDGAVYTVRYAQRGEGFYSHFDPRSREAIIIRSDPNRFRYGTGNWLTCGLMGGHESALMSLGALITHELLGHGTGQGEVNARRTENVHHAARGEPKRCLGGR